MKAAPFAYERPDSLSAALSALNDPQCSAMSGGQSLGPMLNLRLARPARIVDVRRLASLRASRLDQGVLTLGAAVTHAEIEDGLVSDTTHGMLPYVARGIAYRAIRNRGTLGGSLSHADPAADWVNSLVALGAVLHIAGAQGERTLAIDAFIQGTYRTALGAGELLVAVALPAFSPAMRWGYYKVCAKVGEFATAIGAVVVDPELRHCRVVVGAVETLPLQLPDPTTWLDRALKQEPGLVDELETTLANAFPDRDPVFVHQHAIALMRAVAQLKNRPT